MEGNVIVKEKSKNIIEHLKKVKEEKGITFQEISDMTADITSLSFIIVPIDFDISANKSCASSQLTSRAFETALTAQSPTVFLPNGLLLKNLYITCPPMGLLQQKKRTPESNQKSP